LANLALCRFWFDLRGKRRRPHGRTSGIHSVCGGAVLHSLTATDTGRAPPARRYCHWRCSQLGGGRAATPWGARIRKWLAHFAGFATRFYVEDNQRASLFGAPGAMSVAQAASASVPVGARQHEALEQARRAAARGRSNVILRIHRGQRPAPIASTSSLTIGRGHRARATTAYPGGL
jgi:hypothetical protein